MHRIELEIQIDILKHIIFGSLIAVKNALSRI